MKKMLKLSNGVSVQMTLSLSLSTILLLMMCGGVRAWTGEIHGRVVCDVCGDSSIGPEDHALEGAEVAVLCITKSGEVLNYQAFTNSKGIYTVAETMPESDRWDACLARPISSFHEHCVHLGDGNSGVKFGYNHPSEKQAEEEENPNNHADLINTFCEIASASREEALFFLESHNFNLDATAFIHSRSSPPRLYSQFEGGMAAAQLYVAILLLLGFISTSQLQAVAVEPISHLKLNSKILQESIINLVNGNPRAGWKADMSPRFSNYTVGQFKHLLGVKPTPQHDLKNVPVITHSKTVKLPDQFDARTAWPQCSSIGKILDQGHCGSCWAFGAVESLSDRFCIHFGMNISLSVNDLLACCGFLCGDGCDGGYPLYAWRYFVHHGVVTEECDPYFDNTGCSHPGCEPAYATPKCKRKCVNKNLLWRQSKHFSVSAYRIHSDPNNIMAEVYTNGPVEVSFTVYEDFAHYKSGVYKHMTGDVLGGHAVKLIGWGTTEDGEDYWLLANQWNRSWGDDGYFKIKRGTNECGIEEDVTGGLPSSKNLIKEFANMDATLDVSV